MVCVSFDATYIALTKAAQDMVSSSVNYKNQHFYKDKSAVILCCKFELTEETSVITDKEGGNVTKPLPVAPCQRFASISPNTWWDIELRRVALLVDFLIVFKSHSVFNFVGGSSSGAGMRSVESTPQARRKYGGGSTRQPGVTGGNTGGEYINLGTTAASCYPRTTANSVGVTSSVGKMSKDGGDHTMKDDLVSISTPLMHRKTKSEPRYITLLWQILFA